jgi:predicted Zn-dependent protease
MFRIHRLWLLSSALLLAACAGMNTPMPQAGAPAEGGVPAASPQAAQMPQPPAAASAAPAVIAEPVNGGSVDEPQSLVLPPISENTAVLALLDRAHMDSEAGRRDVAGASLERALRIEPRNPWLWHELAQLRLAQGQYAQAVSFAQKSNSFARRDRSLQSRNWRLIGDARVAQGNRAGAEQALHRAEMLDQ